MKSQVVIALDLGGTKLAAALFAADGRRLSKRTVTLDSRAGDAVGQLITRQIQRLLEAADRLKLSVAAIGICVPGIVNSKSGRVWAPNIAGWEDYPIRDKIRRAISNSDMKVVVDSDRSASILGEAWRGAARGCRNAIFVAVGTGIGAGILVDRRVVRGAHSIAGAIGWLALERPFKPEYARCGCFESQASGEGMAKVTQELLARQRNYRGPLRKKAPLTAHDIFAAYEQGDSISKQVLSRAIELWGMASANLISLFNPEKIVFGGGVFGPATKFLDAIATEAQRWAQPIAFRRVAFEASQLGSDAAMYGTAYSALRAARLLGSLGTAGSS